MTTLVPPEVRDEHLPPQPPGGVSWPSVVAIILVLVCTAMLLLTGHTLYDAMLGAAGMALTGNEVARRIIADAGPLPVVIVACAVAVLAAVLVTRGYSLPEAALGAGVAGLIAGETSGRMFGAVRRPWRGV